RSFSTAPSLALLPMARCGSIIRHVTCADPILVSVTRQPISTVYTWRLMATFDFSPHGDTPPAPGDLELLQRFINLHVHDAEGTHLEPPAEQIRGFLVERSLLSEQQRFTHADRETYLALRDAIRNLILAGDDEPVSARDANVLDRIG